MRSRATSIWVGFMLAGLVGFAAIGSDAPSNTFTPFSATGVTPGNCADVGTMSNFPGRMYRAVDAGAGQCRWELMIPGLPPTVGVAKPGIRVSAAKGSEVDQLCVNGHPRKRPTGLTYGHKPVMKGHQRDHYVSLGLGGPDVASNVHYQVLALAEKKDNEERQLERAACKGTVSFDDARAQLAEDWPLDLAHGYDHE